MTTRLTRYSQTENLEQPTSIQSIQGLITTSMGDARTPYSFTDWIKRNVGIIPGKEREQYDGYLKKMV